MTTNDQYFLGQGVQLQLRNQTIRSVLFKKSFPTLVFQNNENLHSNTLSSLHFKQLYNKSHLKRMRVKRVTHFFRMFCRIHIISAVNNIYDFLQWFLLFRSLALLTVFDKTTWISINAAGMFCSERTSVIFHYQVYWRLSWVSYNTSLIYRLNDRYV